MNRRSNSFAGPNCSAWGPLRFSWLKLSAFISIIILSSTFAHAQSSRIINGHPAVGDWPWMVSVGQAGMEPARAHFCGGVLIDSRYVLTAAHCVVDLAGNPQSIQLTLGRRRLTDSGGSVVIADGVIINPGFNSDSLQNDIALVRLSHALPQYLSLPLITDSEARMITPDTQAHLLGWGATDPNFPIRPDTLQEAEVPIVSNEQCSAHLGIDFNPATMICAGTLSSSPDTQDGIDACYGDSGGPLMVETPSGWRLVGITSWGYSCASDRFWGVYTRTSLYTEWVYAVHSVTPYSIEVPSISGIPLVSSKLHCNPGSFGGDAAIRTVTWNDRDSDTQIGQGDNYSIKNWDLGRRIVCTVTMQNSGGAVTIQSDPMGPVFPRRADLVLKLHRSGIVRSAGIYCLRNRCSALISFVHSMRIVRGLIFQGRACSPNNCATSGEWGNANRITETTWAIPIPSRMRNLGGLIVRTIDQASGRSSVLTLTLAH